MMPIQADNFRFVCMVNLNCILAIFPEWGQKDNMSYIITVLKHVFRYLDNDYASNSDVYCNFLTLYKESCDYRNSIQKVSKVIADLKKLQLAIDEKSQEFEDEAIRKR